MKNIVFAIWREPYMPIYWTRQFLTSKFGHYFVEMHHAHYIINYPYGLTWYKILIPRKRGPCQIVDITDQDGNDVKDQILQFLGPGYNFHGIPTTPKMLGYKSLTFSTIFDEQTFIEDKIIVV